MRRDQSKEFGSIVRGYLIVYRVSADQSVLRVWWDALVEYELAEIAQAFEAYGRQHEDPPKPKHIIDLLRDPSRDWWSADIAWARIPKSEEDAAYVNDEMLQAWSVAGDLFAEGDKLGARLAFSRTYQDLVNQARQQGRTPSWFLSRANGNEQANKRAIEDAADWGVLSIETAAQQVRLLNLTDEDPIQSPADLLLAMPEKHRQSLNPEQEHKERGREHIAHLRHILATARDWRDVPAKETRRAIHRVAS